MYVSSKASYTSGLSVAQIEYENQLETHLIKRELQLQKFAWDEAQAQAQLFREKAKTQLASDKAQAQAQIARGKAPAALKTQIGLKKAALKIEFKKISRRNVDLGRGLLL